MNKNSLSLATSVKSILMYTICILVIGCSSDSTDIEEENEIIEEEIEIVEEVEELYFSYDATEFDNERSENWIIIHNSDGVLLDYKSFNGGDIIQFKEYNEALTEKLSITFLSYRSSSNYHGFYGLKTYMDINKGASWRQVASSVQPLPTGKFDLWVNHPPIYPIRINCSTISHSYVYRRLAGSTYTVLNDLNLFGASPYFLSMLDPDSGWKVLKLNNIQNDAFLTVNHTELSDYDSYLEVSLPQVDNAEVSFSITSLNDNAGTLGTRIMAGHSGADEYYPEQLKLGFLDEFNNYSTYISFDTKDYDPEYDYHYTFKQYPEKPLEISIPNQPLISITNDDISNFQLMTDVAYNYKDSIWKYEYGSGTPSFTSTSWTVYSTNEAYSLGKIPEELIDLYPKMNVNSLEHESSILTKTDVYSDFIEREFITGIDRLKSTVIETFEIYK